MIFFQFRSVSVLLFLPRAKHKTVQLFAISHGEYHLGHGAHRRGCHENGILSRSRRRSVSGQRLSYVEKKYSVKVKLHDMERSYHDNSLQEWNIKKNRKELIDKGTSGLKEKIFREFILKNTEISRKHLTPEIALHLMTRDCHLWHSAAEESFRFLEDHGIGNPFWAFYWPGGQALTRYLIDHPSVVYDKIVLDVGSGCGASAIAAAMGGAKSVTANDIDKVAIDAIHLNAFLNNVTIATTSQNLIGCSACHWDVVFLGDMFYDKDFTDTVADWLSYLVQHETEVLIGDPGRLFLQEHPIREELKKIYQIELSEQCQKENNGMTHGFVWTLENLHRR